MKKSLDGCTFGILGDSYSTFQGHIPEGNACYYPNTNVDDVLQVEDTWWYQLAQRSGMRLVINDSYSGATVCTQVRDTQPLAAAFTERAKRSFSGETPLDYILVLGGTNDNWLERTVGKVQFENWTEEDLKQVLPAFCNVFSTLRSCNPDAVILSAINTGFSPELTEGMEAAAAHYGVISLRLEDIHKQNGHPTALGMRQISQQIQAALEK